MAAGTMCMSEYMGFLADADLLGKKLTNREARGIFVQGTFSYTWRI